MRSHLEPDAGGLRLVRFQIEARDRHWWLTVAAMLAHAIAAAMAILGLPPVDLHGPLHKVGIMDPFCGGTRAARYTAQGNFDQAWRYNPLSIVIVWGAGLAILRAAVSFLSRRWVTISVVWTPDRRRWAVAIVVGLLLLLEVRQQMRAELLMAGTHTWR